MLRAWAVSSTALAVAACVPVERVVLDVPAEVVHVAVIELDADGHVTRATPIAAWAPGAALPLITASSRAVVVGWSAALAPPPLAAELPLRGAGTCEPSLPAPVWATAWRDGHLGGDAGEVPPLTASWIFDRCPMDPPPQLDAAWSCGDGRCVPRVSRTGPCRLSIGLEPCGAGSVEAFESPDGALCVDPRRATLACVEAEAPPGAFAAMRCEAERTCTLELFDPARAVPPFSVRSVALTSAPQADLGVGSLGGVQPEMMNRGHAYDLAINGDHVFVSGPADGSGFPRCEQRPDRTSKLRVFDAEQLEEIATATAGPCLGALGRDLHGPGALGVFLDPSGVWSLGRFGVDARLVDAAPIPRLSPVLDAPGHTVDRLLVMPARAEVAVLFRPAEGEPPSSVVTVHDARTLAEKWRRSLGTERVGAGLRLDGDDVLLTLLPQIQLLQAIDLEGRQLGNRDLTGIATGRENVSHDVLPLGPDTDRLIVAQGFRKLIHLTRNGVWTAVPPLSSDADLTRVERWPADPRLLLVAGTQRREGRLRAAEVALYDPTERRFLPGAWEIGGGVVSRIVEDTAGRVLLLLPWSGALVRLDPRP